MCVYVYTTILDYAKPTNCPSHCICSYIHSIAILLATVEPVYILWTPWDQPKVSRLSRCPDFPGQFASFGITARYVDYAGVHIFKCPD